MEKIPEEKKDSNGSSRLEIGVRARLSIESTHGVGPPGSSKQPGRCWTRSLHRYTTQHNTSVVHHAQLLTNDTTSGVVFLIMYLINTLHALIIID